MQASKFHITLIVTILAFSAATLAFLYPAENSQKGLKDAQGAHCSFGSCTNFMRGGPHTSGIQGNVTLGPACPVETYPRESSCADRPYATLIAIFRASDPVHAIMITTSGTNGEFSATVPAGDYIIGTGESNIPSCKPLSVTVPANEVVKVAINCDSGIR